MSSSVLNDLSGFSQALTDLVTRTAPSVVAVKAAPYRVVSGIVLEGGLIAVTDHTLKREDRVSVHAFGGEEILASILGRDPSVDVAILKIDSGGGSPLPLADVTTLHAGTLAAVVGLTADVGPTASLGILGAVGPSRRTWRGGTLDHFLRLDVNLYPSQAGAAVVTAEGKLIGMATGALLRQSGVALPVSTIRRVADELLKEGRIRYGYLGVGLQPVAVRSTRHKLQNVPSTGLIVLSVEPDSPADNAGVQIGDIFITLAGKPVMDVEELQMALRGDVVGRSVPATLLRGGEPLEVTITISERITKEN
ncbi:MAG: serine protease [Acidobacteriaceae bacterium]|nr:serine protease [Acidobacteriaceae bacterium]